MREREIDVLKSVYMVFIFCVACVLLAGCGSERPAGGAAPGLQVRVVSSDELRREIGSGDAPLTMVHIWATWCPPCIEEFPELIELNDRFETYDLNIILLSADNPSA